MSTPTDTRSSPAGGMRSDYYAYLLALLFVGGACLFLTWPVSGTGDTDLWYHLNGGRYLFTHGRIPATGFFSFLAEDRTWVNYYWLFQALVYFLHAHAGYYGLIVLRTLLFLATLGLTAGFLLQNQRDERCRFFFSLVTVLFFVALITRYFTVVRPHQFSYLFIVAFILLLETRKPVSLFLLPLLAVCWNNLHGVEYPVMMLLCAAYIAEIFWNRFRQKRTLTDREIKQLLFIVPALWTVFLNPFGWRLLQSPFASAPGQHLYIAELGRMEPAGLFTFGLDSTGAVSTSASNLLLLLGVAGLLIGLRRRRLAVSHLLLFAGGLYLLLGRAERFRYEAVLLALPLLRAHPLPAVFAPAGQSRGPGRRLAAGLLVLLTLFFVHRTVTPRPRFPFSEAELPAGAAAFLQRVDTGGSILNVPDHGGYFQWMLPSTYSITMDLEMMLFTDADIFLTANSFLDPVVLKRFIDRYHPAFITPLLANRTFPGLIEEHPDYMPVFFDDTVAVYADRRQKPELVEKYRLRESDPYGLAGLDIGSLPRGRARSMLAELLRLRTIHPRGILVNQALSLLYQRLGAPDPAQAVTAALVRSHPESVTGYRLLGDLAMGRQEWRKAVKRYRQALARAEDNKDAGILEKLSICYSRLGEKERAYETLQATVNIFSSRTGYRTLMRLGILAGEADRPAEAVRLLEFALLKTPATDREARDRLLTLIDKNTASSGSAGETNKE